jgi:hypothetical protein
MLHLEEEFMSGRDLVSLDVQPEHSGTRLLRMLQQRHPEYHPAMSIADLAHTAEEEELRFKCHSTLLKYVEPELRSVQIQADVKETRTIRVSLFETIEHTDNKKELQAIEEAKSQAPSLPSIIDVVAILSDTDE